MIFSADSDRTSREGNGEMKTTIAIYEALKDFCKAVRRKLSQVTVGEPEDQLRGPFENFMGAVASALGWKVVCTGEARLCNHLGQPDYAVHLNGLLAG